MAWLCRCHQSFPHFSKKEVQVPKNWTWPSFITNIFYCQTTFKSKNLHHLWYGSPYIFNWLFGANTYLIQQFFSPHSNRRNDRRGGSVEKRFTFINQLVDTITNTVNDYAHSPFVVGYRFSPEENKTPGIRLKDTLYLVPLYLVDQLANKNLDYLHISLNDYKRVSMSDEYKEKAILEYMMPDRLK